MSEKRNENVKAASSFAYRNIKKDFTEFEATPVITPNAHLELGENYEVKVVDDHPDDWFEITQRDVDQIGLKNILEIARRRGENPFDGRYAFKDEEALDLGDLDPKDPESVKKAAGASEEAYKKLQATAENLGVSVEDLISAAFKGSLDKLISEKTTKTEEGGQE